MNIARDDYNNYNEGWVSTSTSPTAARPSPDTAFPPSQSVTQNGWSTYEEREGQRVRITFTDGVYTSGTPNTISSASGAFANYTQPGGGVTPLWIRGGATEVPQFVGITGKDGSGNLQLNRAITGVTGNLSGYIWSDLSIQGVPNLPTSDPKTVVFGGDESAAAIYKYTVNSGGERIDPRIVHGVMTDLTHGYTTVPNDGTDRNLGWLGLLGAFWPGFSGGSFAVNDYLMHVTPNAPLPWRRESRAQTVLYSPDGDVWGELFAPNHPSEGGANLQLPSAFFGNDVFIGRADTISAVGLYSTPRPRLSGTTSRAITARPMVISGGGTNLLKRHQTSSSIEDIENFNGPGGTNLVRAVGRNSTPPEVALSDTNIIESVPLPPCGGPIMRLSALDHSYLCLFKLTNPLAFGTLPRMRTRLWVYRLPSAKPNKGENVMPTSAPAFFGMTLGIVPQGVGYYASDSRIRKSPYLLPDWIAGTGWTPVTLSANYEGTNPDPMPSYELYAELYTAQTGFARQDVLVAWDYVVASDGLVDLPEQPLVPATPGNPDTPIATPTETWIANYSNPVPTSTSWSIFLGLRIPDSGPDAFTKDRIGTPSSLTVCTLRGSSTSYLRIVLDRGGSFTTTIPEHRLQIIDHNGTVWSISGPASGDDGINLAQPFLFLRGRQILLGISREGSTYRAWVSVGGTRVKFATTATLAGVIPKSFRIGDINGANVDTAEFFGYWADDASASSESEGTLKLKSLDWLT